MKRKFVYLLMLSIVLFSACSTDLDINGQYKETMIVYGLLDQSQAKQYIKVNKAFLGQGNSVTYAAIKDSTQFVNALNVKLQKLNGVGAVMSEHTLSPDNSIPKDPGTFYAPDQANAIYSIDAATLGVGFFDTGSNYKLVVTNSESGTQITAQTSLITDIGNFEQPAPATTTFTFLISTSSSHNYNIRWLSGKNAKLYQTVIRFNYVDSTSTSNDTSHVDWVFPVQTTQKLDGGEELTTQFDGQNFLRFVSSQLAGKPLPIARKALKTDIILIAGSDDLNTYIQVNAPSTGIIQEKPLFTNINNGLGIFTSRYNKPPFSRPLNSTTLDSLACGQYTKGLKFLDSQGHLSCP